MGEENTRLDELVTKFKAPRALSTEERDELVELIESAKDAEGFSIKALADEHGLDKKAYARLRKVVGPGYRGKVGGPFDRKLREAERSDRAKFIRDWWEMQRSIGEEAIMGYSQKAAERGMKIADWVKTALAFYDEHGDRVEMLEDENRQLKAMCNILIEATKPVFRKQAVLRLYHDFIISVHQLRAMGITVSQSAIEDARQRCLEAIA